MCARRIAGVDLLSESQRVALKPSWQAENEPILASMGQAVSSRREGAGQSHLTERWHLRGELWAHICRSYLGQSMALLSDGVSADQANGDDTGSLGEEEPEPTGDEATPVLLRPLGER